MYISEEEVRAVLTYEALIPAIRQALIDYSAGQVEQPARLIMRAGNAEGHRNGWFAVMPVIHGDVMGVKTVTFFPGNAEARYSLRTWRWSSCSIAPPASRWR